MKDIHFTLVCLVIFTVLTARTLISSLPMAPTLDSDVNVSCIVQIEELICPSGMLSLQLPNGSVIIKEIISSVTEIELRINTISLGDFGRYYCNISVTSPQFPNIGLRAFEGIHLKGNVLSESSLNTNNSHYDCKSKFRYPTRNYKEQTITKIEMSKQASSKKMFGACKTL